VSYAVAILTIFDVLILPVSISNYDLPLWLAVSLSLVHGNEKGGFSLILIYMLLR